LERGYRSLSHAEITREVRTAAESPSPCQSKNQIPAGSRDQDEKGEQQRGKKRGEASRISSLRRGGKSEGRSVTKKRNIEGIGPSGCGREREESSDIGESSEDNDLAESRKKKNKEGGDYKKRVQPPFFSSWSSH